MSSVSADNILFIFTDQQRADSLGAYGGHAETPNLDRLAADGTRYDRAYTRTAICSPSRAAVVSGVPPHENGVERNVDEETRLHEEYPCYPQLLRNAGYNVGLDGKWHLGSPRKRSEWMVRTSPAGIRYWTIQPTVAT